MVREGVTPMSSVKVRDFTTLAEPSESVVLVYFEEADGVVHVYRDGTVVLASPQGTTVARLPQPDGRVWRREGYLALLARLGATEDELARAADTIVARDDALAYMGFDRAFDHALAEARVQYDAWAARQPPDVAQMDEVQVDDWLAARLAELRAVHD
jgi:hypothetical protein